MRIRVMWYNSGKVLCNLPVSDVQRAVNICRCYKGTVVITSTDEIIYSHM